MNRVDRIVLDPIRTYACTRTARTGVRVTARPTTRTAWKTKLSTDVNQAKLEVRYEQKLTVLTLHNGMGLPR